MKNNKTRFAVMSTIMSIIMPILIPILIIVLLAGAVIAVFNGIIDIITEVCGNLVDFLNDPLGWFGSVVQDVWNFVVSITPGERNKRPV
ncbi:MAG TPA: hypothetical protein DCE23_02520 [Firmicutes bacterium]|nr:hypothetical protein [Bacillota bacterium]